MARSVQGKCTPCRLRYVWRGRPLLRAARCPRCRRFLERTSIDLQKFPTVVESPVEDVAEATTLRDRAGREVR